MSVSIWKFPADWATEGSGDQTMTCWIHSTATVSFDGSQTRVRRIVGHLTKFKHAALRCRTGCPGYENLSPQEHDWDATLMAMSEKKPVMMLANTHDACQMSRLFANNGCHEHKIHDGIHTFPQCILQIPATSSYSQAFPNETRQRRLTSSQKLTTFSSATLNHANLQYSRSNP